MNRARVALTAAAQDKAPCGEPVEQPYHRGVTQPKPTTQFLDSHSRVVGDLHQRGRRGSALTGNSRTGFCYLVSHAKSEHSEQIGCLILCMLHTYNLPSSLWKRGRDDAGA